MFLGNNLTHVVAIHIVIFIPIDNIVRVHSDDLQKVEQELDALRMSVFQFLKPKLQCKLGKKIIVVLYQSKHHKVKNSTLEHRKCVNIYLYLLFCLLVGFFFVILLRSRLGTLLLQF